MRQSENLRLRLRLYKISKQERQRVRGVPDTQTEVDAWQESFCLPKRWFFPIIREAKVQIFDQRLSGVVRNLELRIPIFYSFYRLYSEYARSCGQIGHKDFPLQRLLSDNRMTLVETFKMSCNVFISLVS